MKTKTKKKSTSSSVSPIATLFEWDPTAKPGHAPAWFRKRLRGYLASQGHDAVSPDLVLGSTGARLDHWGSVGPKKPGAQRALYSMPYTKSRKMFDKLAKAINCRVEVVRPGAWDHKTTCFLLHPKFPRG